MLLAPTISFEDCSLTDELSGVGPLFFVFHHDLDFPVLLNSFCIMLYVSWPCALLLLKWSLINRKVDNGYLGQVSLFQIEMTNYQNDIDVLKKYNIRIFYNAYLGSCKSFSQHYFGNVTVHVMALTIVTQFIFFIYYAALGIKS